MSTESKVTTKSIFISKTRPYKQHKNMNDIFMFSEKFD